jgi:S1-C subfamily serine protease
MWFRPPTGSASSRTGASFPRASSPPHHAVIGTPYGFGYSLSVGHVSGRLMPRQTVTGVPLEFIQTDAHISRGNSGGPMFTLRREVVGVVSWMPAESGSYEGLGFAVSANVAKRLPSSTGSFWTGVEGVLLTG